MALASSQSELVRTKLTQAELSAHVKRTIHLYEEIAPRSAILDVDREVMLGIWQSFQSYLQDDIQDDLYA